MCLADSKTTCSNHSRKNKCNQSFELFADIGDVLGVLLKMLPLSSCIALACTCRRIHANDVLEILKDRLLLTAGDGDLLDRMPWHDQENTSRAVRVVARMSMHRIGRIPHWKFHLDFFDTAKESETTGSYEPICQAEADLGPCAELSRRLRGLNDVDSLRMDHSVVNLAIKEPSKLSPYNMNGRKDTNLVWFRRYKMGADLADISSKSPRLDVRYDVDIRHRNHKRTKFVTKDGHFPTFNFSFLRWQNGTEFGSKPILSTYAPLLSRRPDDSIQSYGLKVELDLAVLPNHQKNNLRNINERNPITLTSNMVRTIMSFGIGDAISDFDMVNFREPNTSTCMVENTSQFKLVASYLNSNKAIPMWIERVLSTRGSFGLHDEYGADEEHGAKPFPPVCEDAIF